MCTFVSDYVCNCVCVCNVYMCVHVYTCGCVPLSRHIVGPLWTLPASGNLIVLAVPMAQSGWVDKPFLLCILTPTIQLINFIAFAMRREWAECEVWKEEEEKEEQEEQEQKQEPEWQMTIACQALTYLSMECGLII